MKKITGYLRAYILAEDKRVLLLSMLFIAIGIYVNYSQGLNGIINAQTEPLQFLGWFLVFFVAFLLPYVIYESFHHKGFLYQPGFLLLLIAATSIFAWKMSFNLHVTFTSNKLLNNYWNQVFYWPFKLMVVTLALWLIWYFFDRTESFYGLQLKNFQPKPYWTMLLIMLPLIALASSQHDFLAMYPKLKNIAFLHQYKNTGFYKIVYELSYGSDFFTIELFFRGFLVLAFSKWCGKDAILPMACFYCTIHFGKPLGECISSFFGGMILGIVTYHTRTIFGGLMVHLGIAWMMELGGYLGNLFYHTGHIN